MRNADIWFPHKHVCQLYTLVSRRWHCWSVIGHLWSLYAILNKLFLLFKDAFVTYMNLSARACAPVWVSLTQFHQGLQVNGAFTCSSKTFCPTCIGVFVWFIYFIISNVTAWHRFSVIKTKPIEQWMSNMCVYSVHRETKIWFNLSSSWPPNESVILLICDVIIIILWIFFLICKIMFYYIILHYFVSLMPTFCIILLFHLIYFES